MFERWLDGQVTTAEMLLHYTNEVEDDYDDESARYEETADIEWRDAHNEQI